MPASKAAVFMQNTYNFRKYLRRVDADDQGFFRFVDVPGDEPYFVFATPPGGGPAMREFVHFSVPASIREIWRELTLHPHSISGKALVSRAQKLCSRSCASALRPTRSCGHFGPRVRVRSAFRTCRTAVIAYRFAREKAG